MTTIVHARCLLVYLVQARLGAEVVARFAAVGGELQGAAVVESTELGAHGAPHAAVRQPQAAHASWRTRAGARCRAATA